MRKAIITVILLLVAMIPVLYSMEWSRKYVVEYRVYLEKLDRYVRYQVGLPLRGTPDLKQLKERLRSAGLKLGDPVFMRIFKEEHVLELWIKKDDSFERFATYPICMWSGRVGPKLKQGDHQAPEGFYTVSKGQLNPNSRWYRSFNLGYPNLYDRSFGRTGNYLMVHGGCSSIGCYAMTNPVIKEIWALTTAALNKGQARFHVQALPFRMSEWNMRLHGESKWLPFWQDLKKGYDLFEQSHVPPVVSVCEKRYQVRPGNPGNDGSAALDNGCDAPTAQL